MTAKDQEDHLLAMLDSFRRERDRIVDSLEPEDDGPPVIEPGLIGRLVALLLYLQDEPRLAEMIETCLARLKEQYPTKDPAHIIRHLHELWNEPTVEVLQERMAGLQQELADAGTRLAELRAKKKTIKVVRTGETG